MKKRISVLVTAVGGGGVGEQVVKALRLAGDKYRIIGTDVTRISKTLYEVDHPYLVPGATDRSYLDTLLNLCERHDVKAVFVGSDPELKKIGRARKLFGEEGIFLPINPGKVIDICADKIRTSAWLSVHGFRHPRTVTLSSPDDLDAVDFFPSVIKPPVGSGGSKNVFLVRDRKELGWLGSYLLSLGGKLLLQEYLGNAESEYTVGVLLSMEGEIINSIAVKRNIETAISSRIALPDLRGAAGSARRLVISSGISQGEIGRFPEVTGTCEQIALRLGCRGVVNIQCRYHRGEAFVFEINPRFSGTTSCRALAGYNEPDVLIDRHVLGRSIRPHFSYRTGLVLRGLCETFVGRREIPSAIARGTAKKQ
jgi:carbamoyl-phosphate synthase large subunit